MLTRRALITTAAVSAAALAQRRRPPSLKVSIFSKHLQFLQGDALAETAAKLGFDGIDLTVHKGGHVEPERVRQDLPKLVGIIRRHGLEVPMVTTDIVDRTTPFTEHILATLAELGIYHYRWGGFKYESSTPIPRQLDALKPRVAALASLNARYHATAMYHTHSGIRLVGASIWDLYLILQDFDPDSVAVNFDIGHATVEGGFGGWINSFDVIRPWLRGVAVKDFLWEKDAKSGWTPAWKPLGAGMVRFPDFFEMLGGAGFNGPLQLHFEYPLGGAENGKRKLTLSQDAVLSAMQRDLERLRGYLKTGAA